MSAGQRIAVVDLDDRFLRWEERHTIHVERLVHRSIHVLVFDSEGRLLIQRRHRDKQTYPSHWDDSCAGHVEEPDYTGGPDEDLDAVYQAVARRELEEELGIKPEISLLGHFPPIADVHYEQLRLFRADSDGPFVLQPEEVEEVRRVTCPELEAMIAGGEAVTDALRYFSSWARAQGHWR
jgi:isopentenyldiphosphate isomerase